MNLNVLAFGPLAETLGWKRKEIHAIRGATVQDVLALLDYPEHRSVGLMVAVNGQQCETSRQLNDGDELALLPPVSGG